MGWRQFNPLKPQVSGPQPCRKEDALHGQRILAWLQEASGPVAPLQRQRPTLNASKDENEVQTEQ